MSFSSVQNMFFRCCYQLRTEVRFFQPVTEFKFPVKIILQFSLKIDSEHSLILLFAKFGLNFIAHSSLFRFFAQKNIKSIFWPLFGVRTLVKIYNTLLHCFIWSGFNYIFSIFFIWSVFFMQVEKGSIYFEVFTSWPSGSMAAWPQIKLRPTLILAAWQFGRNPKYNTKFRPPNVTPNNHQ